MARVDFKLHAKSLASHTSESSGRRFCKSPRTYSGVPDWHRKVLVDPLEQHRDDPDDVPWDEVRDHVRDKFRRTRFHFRLSTMA